MRTFQTPGKKAWSDLIGKAILDFGHIEYVTFECLKYLPTENIFNSVSKMGLTQRVDLIINIIQSRFTDQPETDKFVKLLQKVKTLSKNRNLIAHNPLSLDIFENDSGEITEFNEIIQSLRNISKTMSFTELQEFSKNVAELTISLQEGYEAIYELLP